MQAETVLGGIFGIHFPKAAFISVIEHGKTKTQIMTAAKNTSKENIFHFTYCCLLTLDMVSLRLNNIRH